MHRRRVPDTSPPVHAWTYRCRAGGDRRGRTAEGGARSDYGGSPERNEGAARLPLPHALPLRGGTVPSTGTRGNREPEEARRTVPRLPGLSLTRLPTAPLSAVQLPIATDDGSFTGWSALE